MSNRYPSKLVPEPGGDFVVHQFILPIRIDGNLIWGWLDTGANVSIIPKEIATGDLDLDVTDEADGGYDLAGLVRVPYQNRTFQFEIMEYIKGTLPSLTVHPYRYSGEALLTLRDLELQVLTLSWPEIIEKLHPVPPLFPAIRTMPWVILGSDSILEHLIIEMDGTEEVKIASRK